MKPPVSNILSLDVGNKRVGVAMTNSLARLPSPLKTIEMGANFWQELTDLIAENEIDEIAVGLPRNLSGEDTEQTLKVRKFADELKQKTGLKVTLQDEALTSVMAEKELIAKGKKYTKGDIDAMAAVYILEDYLRDREL